MTAGYRRARYVVPAAVLGLGLLVTVPFACSPPEPSPVGRGDLTRLVDLQGQTYRVGTKPGFRRELLCRIAVATLQDAGAGVVDGCADSGDARGAFDRDRIDLYWEDTGTAAARAFLQSAPAASEVRAGSPGSGAVELDRARLALPGRFAAPVSTARRSNLQTMADVARATRVGEPVTWCGGTADVAGGGADGDVRDATRRYDMPPQPATVPLGALTAGDGDARTPPCTVYLVDPVEDLPDDAGMVRLRAEQPDVDPVRCAPVVRAATFGARPDVATVLGFVTRQLDDEALSVMTRKVRDGFEPDDVTRDWVRDLPVPPKR